MFSIGADTQEKEYYLFVGNPGVGKSSLINGLIGKKVFESGLSIGEGLTSTLQSYENEGRVFIDTPGLADIAKMKEAAEEIKKALQKNGIYHLFFVFNLKSLRIVKEDLATMDIILDAINHPDLKYNLLINNMKAREMNRLKNKDSMAKFLVHIAKMKYNKASPVFIEEDLDFMDEEGEILTLHNNVKDFILKKSTSMRIYKEQVNDIAWNQYQDLLDVTSKKIQELNEKIKNKDEEIVRLEGNIKRAIDNPPQPQVPQPQVIIIKEESKNTDFWEGLGFFLDIGITLASIFF